MKCADLGCQVWTFEHNQGSWHGEDWPVTVIRPRISMQYNYDPIYDSNSMLDLDLALAVELQAMLMPAEKLLDAPNYRAVALNRMCGRVGGDFCEFIRLNNDQVAIAVGDVTGRGVQASLLMAGIMGLLRRRPAECSRPAAIVRMLNEMLLDLGDRIGSPMSCSLFYVVLDTPTDTAFFINDSLPAPVLTDREAGTVVRIGLPCPMLGVEDFEPEECCHTFLPGQRLILCSDGVLNATDPNSMPFGEDRLEQAIRRYIDAPCKACARALFAVVDRFRRGTRQRDDETVLIVDRL